MMSGRQFIRLQSTGLWGLEAVFESYHKLQTKPKTVLEFWDAIRLSWSALSEEDIDKVGKDLHKRLQACV